MIMCKSEEFSLEAIWKINISIEAFYKENEQNFSVEMHVHCLT